MRTNKNLPIQYCYENIIFVAMLLSLFFIFILPRIFCVFYSDENGGNRRIFNGRETDPFFSTAVPPRNKAISQPSTSKGHHHIIPQRLKSVDSSMVPAFFIPPIPKVHLPNPLIIIKGFL